MLYCKRNGATLRLGVVLFLLTISGTIARSQAPDSQINHIIQSPAPMPGSAGVSRSVPVETDRVRSAVPVPKSRAEIQGESSINAVIRALSPREAPPPVVVALASGTFLVTLVDHVRHWSPASSIRLRPDEILPISVEILGIPAPLTAAWPQAPSYGIVVAQSQIALVERSSRRVAVVIDRATGVAFGPGTRFIVIYDKRTSRAIALDLRASFDQDVYFTNNSSKLSDVAREQLLALGMALQSPSLGNARFLISGHTNSVGSDLANRELSFRRAVVVRDHLIRNFGLAPEKIDMYGFGADRLKFPHAPRHPGNRRVEIALVIGEVL